MALRASTGLTMRVGAAGLLAASIVLGLVGAGAVASTRSHTTQEATPLGRSWTSWVYDPAQQDVVLFGGNGGNGPWPPGKTFGDTWTWKNGCWTQHHPVSSPPSRQGAAMAWDPATRQLLLFGGGFDSANPQFYGDTWIWNGNNWIQLHPATSPAPRHQADMIYDAAMHEIILFGGHGVGAQNYFNDTWAWNGTTWTQLHPATSPSPRDTFSLVYFPPTQTVILYGGFSNGIRLSDTWSFNGTTWTQLTPAQSPGVVSPAWQAAYDSASHQLVLYGGDVSVPPQYAASMWAWTGTTWAQLHPLLGPGPRGYGAMTYDQAQRRIVLFGGNDGTSDPRDVLGWDGKDWDTQTCCHG
jgi:hypothetical protein